jgi:hypothetical protein
MPHSPSKDRDAHPPEDSLPSDADAAPAVVTVAPVPRASPPPPPSSAPPSTWDPFGSRSGVAAAWLAALVPVVALVVTWRRQRARARKLPLAPAPRPVVTVRKDDFPELFAAVSRAPASARLVVQFSSDVWNSFEYATALVALLEAEGREVSKGHGPKLGQNVHVELRPDEVRIKVGSAPGAGARHNITVG